MELHEFLSDEAETDLRVLDCPCQPVVEAGLKPSISWEFAAVRIVDATRKWGTLGRPSKLSFSDIRCSTARGRFGRTAPRTESKGKRCDVFCTLAVTAMSIAGFTLGGGQPGSGRWCDEHLHRDKWERYDHGDHQWPQRGKPWREVPAAERHCSWPRWNRHMAE
jgi:hypothetical protein